MSMPADRSNSDPSEKNYSLHILFGSSPGRGHCVVFMGKTLSPKVPRYTQVYTCIMSTLRWTSILSKGE